MTAFGLVDSSLTVHIEATDLRHLLRPDTSAWAPGKCIYIPGQRSFDSPVVPGGAARAIATATVLQCLK